MLFPPFVYNAFMRKVNNIELSDSEFKELSTLVNYDQNKVCEFVNSRLVDKSNIVNFDLSDIYLELLSYKLVEGYVNEWGAFVSFHCVTRRGRDFIADYAQLQKEKREALMSDRKFQIGLSLATLAVSFLVSFLTSLCLQQPLS